MAWNWPLIVQGVVGAGSLAAAGVAAWVAYRSTKAQERATEIAETMLRLEEIREKDDLARFTLHMERRPYADRTVLRRGSRTPLQFRVENTGKRGSAIKRVDIEFTEENGTKHAPRAAVQRADPGREKADLFVEAGTVAIIDVFPEEDDLPKQLKPAVCRTFVRVVPVHGEQARSEWHATIGSHEWTHTL